MIFNLDFQKWQKGDGFYHELPIRVTTQITHAVIEKMRVDSRFSEEVIKSELEMLKDQVEQQFLASFVWSK